MKIQVPTLAKWSTGKLVVTLTGLPNEFHTVRAVAETGQVTVDTQPQSFTGTSAILEFRVDSKKKSSRVTISGPCGSQTVTVNVK